MKSKKFMFVAVLAMLIALGWLVALSASNSTKVIDEQTALVEKADILASKKLYIRAIPQYIEALKHKTANNPAIEEKLLEAYYKYNRENEYIRLVESRIKDGTATEAEIKTAAMIHFSHARLNKMLALLNKGIALTGSEALVELYEDNRYYYTLRTTNYTEIIPTEDNDVMPATDGQKWFYINTLGARLTSSTYESATPPNPKGYAVVTIDGTYYVITGDESLYGLDETGLDDVLGISSYIIGKKDGKWSYYNADFINVSPSIQYDDITQSYNGYAAFRIGDKWGIMTDTGTIVPNFTVEDVAINSHGAVFVNNAGMVKINGLWYLVSPTGEKLIADGFADAKAPESNDGMLAVANADEKWGFINREGKLVIDYQFDDAKSFSHHLAAVKSDRLWGYISERGELVIDEPLTDAQPFRNGIAQGVIQNEAVIIDLLIDDN